MPKDNQGEDTTSKISTHEGGIYGVRFNVSLPKDYSASGFDSYQYFDAYIGFTPVFGKKETVVEIGVGFYGEKHKDIKGNITDAPFPHKFSTFVNPVKGDLTDGKNSTVSQPKSPRQRNSAYIQAKEGGTVKMEVILDAKNNGSLLVNGHNFENVDTNKLGHNDVTTFTYGYPERSDNSLKGEKHAHGVMQSVYEKGFDLKLCIGYVDQDKNVHFSEISITATEVYKKDKNGNLKWIPASQVDFSKASPLKGAIQDSSGPTLIISRSKEQMLAEQRELMHKMGFDGPPLVDPKLRDPINPLFNNAPDPYTKHSLLNDPLHITALSAMMRLNTEFGIPTDQRTHNAAAFLTVAGHEKGLKQIDCVKSSDDGDKLFAIQGAPGTSFPNKVVVVPTMLALNASIDESAASYAKALVNKAEQSPAISNQQSLQVDPAVNKIVPIK